MKRGIAISFILLTTISWFASYFTLKLIDRVIIENKLTIQEQQESQYVVEALHLPEKTHLKRINIENKLKLGYAVPFIVPYNEKDYYEVVDNIKEIKVENNTLQLVKVKDSERGSVVLILSSLFQFYYFNPSKNTIEPSEAVVVKANSIYLQKKYNHSLSVTVPPPRS